MKKKGTNSKSNSASKTNVKTNTSNKMIIDDEIEDDNVIIDNQEDDVVMDNENKHNQEKKAKSKSTNFNVSSPIKSKKFSIVQLSKSIKSEAKKKSNANIEDFSIPGIKFLPKNGAILDRKSSIISVDNEYNNLIKKDNIKSEEQIKREDRKNLYNESKLICNNFS